MAENDTNLPTLDVVTEKVMPQKTKKECLAYCPTMDLLAVAAENEQLHVFRLNGQRVFGTASSVDKNLVLSRLRWKPDGKLLAAGYNDGTVRLFNAYTGKMVHQLQACSDPIAKICCLGWGMNYTRSGSQRGQDRKRSNQTLSEIFGNIPNDMKTIPPNLPRELALLDIENTLPKLSPLPSIGKEDDVFSSRASLDAIFHSSSDDDETVDVLITGLEDGKLHIHIFNSFLIGEFDVGKLNPQWKTYTPFFHCSTPTLSTHVIFFSVASDPFPLTYLVPVVLKFIPASGLYLSLVASKSTQLQNLLRYIQQAGEQMKTEWNNAQEIPQRYIHGANDDLQKRSGCDFVTAIYHLLCTGNCFGPLKEFFVEQVTERGHKRWDKSITTGYENVRRIVLENLLPALERSAVLVSRLRGLSSFTKSNAVTGLNPKDLSEILETLDNLMFLSHDILNMDSQELGQFTAFSSWFRQEIDRLVTDPNSVAAEEIAEKETAVDYGQALDYIEGPLTRSQLDDLLGSSSTEIESAALGVPSQGTMFHENHRTGLHRNARMEVKQKPHLQDLTSLLYEQCAKIFEQIAHTERKNVFFGKPVFLGSQISRSIVDSKMQSSADKGPVVHIASITNASSDYIVIYRITLPPDDDTSRPERLDAASIKIENVRVKDLKMLDDEFMIFLLEDDERSYLLRLPYAEAKGDNIGPTYIQLTHNGPRSCPVFRIQMTDPALIGRYWIHTFKQDAKMVPEKIEINTRKGRRAIWVQSRDMRHYAVFDLESLVVYEDTDDEEDSDIRDMNPDPDAMVL